MLVAIVRAVAPAADLFPLLRAQLSLVTASLRGRMPPWKASTARTDDGLAPRARPISQPGSPRRYLSHSASSCPLVNLTRTSGPIISGGMLTS